jgi:hypothetical protein
VPIFYFHLHSGEAFARDTDGEEFPDLGTALEQAKLTLAKLAAADAGSGKTALVGLVSITDENDDELASVAIEGEVRKSLH